MKRLDIRMTTHVNVYMSSVENLESNKNDWLFQCLFFLWNAKKALETLLV